MRTSAKQHMWRSAGAILAGWALLLFATAAFGQEAAPAPSPDAATPKEAVAAPPDAPNEAAELFKKYDTNGDGNITADEFAAARTAAKARGKARQGDQGPRQRRKGQDEARRRHQGARGEQQYAGRMDRLRNMSPDERRRAFAQLSPEDRQRLKEKFHSRAGGQYGTPQMDRGDRGGRGGMMERLRNMSPDERRRLFAQASPEQKERFRQAMSARQGQGRQSMRGGQGRGWQQGGPQGSGRGSQGYGAYGSPRQMRGQGYGSRGYDEAPRQFRQGGQGRGWQQGGPQGSGRGGQGYGAYGSPRQMRGQGYGGGYDEAPPQFRQGGQGRGWQQGAPQGQGRGGQGYGGPQQFQGPRQGGQGYGGYGSPRQMYGQGRNANRAPSRDEREIMRNWDLLQDMGMW